MYFKDRDKSKKDKPPPPSIIVRDGGWSSSNNRSTSLPGSTTEPTPPSSPVKNPQDVQVSALKEELAKLCGLMSQTLQSLECLDKRVKQLETIGSPKKSKPEEKKSGTFKRQIPRPHAKDWSSKSEHIKKTSGEHKQVPEMAEQVALEQIHELDDFLKERDTKQFAETCGIISGLADKFAKERTDNRQVIDAIRIDALQRELEEMKVHMMQALQLNAKKTEILAKKECRIQQLEEVLEEIKKNEENNTPKSPGRVLQRSCSNIDGITRSKTDHFSQSKLLQSKTTIELRSKSKEGSGLSGSTPDLSVLTHMKASSLPTNQPHSATAEGSIKYQLEMRRMLKQSNEEQNQTMANENQDVNGSRIRSTTAPSQVEVSTWKGSTDGSKATNGERNQFLSKPNVANRVAETASEEISRSMANSKKVMRGSKELTTTSSDTPIKKKKKKASRKKKIKSKVSAELPNRHSIISIYLFYINICFKKHFAIQNSQTVRVHITKQHKVTK